jgi:flagellar motor switch/type III secretory pathway protein FliN
MVHVQLAHATGLDLLLGVPVSLSVELGRTAVTVAETLGIAPGNLIALDTGAGESVALSSPACKWAAARSGPSAICSRCG